MGHPHFTGEDDDWGDGGRRCARFNGPPPPIVVLCGSTRFWDEFQRQSLRLTLEGKIVLSVGAATASDVDHIADGTLRPGDKVRLDELHKRKIDLGHEVFVLNVGNYIGESTTSEILYAAEHHVPIKFLEPGCFTLPDGDCINDKCELHSA